MPPDGLIAFTTFPTPEAARAAVEDLVRGGLVAGGTVVPGATSVYRWRGEVVTSDEALVVLKLAADRFAAVEARLIPRHPYEVPELIAVPIAAAHGAYLDWLLSAERQG